MLGTEQSSSLLLTCQWKRQTTNEHITVSVIRPLQKTKCKWAENGWGREGSAALYSWMGVAPVRSCLREVSLCQDHLYLFLGGVTRVAHLLHSLPTQLDFQLIDIAWKGGKICIPLLKDQSSNQNLALGGLQPS